MNVLVCGCICVSKEVYICIGYTKNTYTVLCLIAANKTFLFVEKVFCVKGFEFEAIGGAVQVLCVKVLCVKVSVKVSAWKVNKLLLTNSFV